MAFSHNRVLIAIGKIRSIDGGVFTLEVLEKKRDSDRFRLQPIANSEPVRYDDVLCKASQLKLMSDDVSS